MPGEGGCAPNAQSAGRSSLSSPSRAGREQRYASHAAIAQRPVAEGLEPLCRRRRAHDDSVGRQRGGAAVLSPHATKARRPEPSARGGHSWAIGPTMDPLHDLGRRYYKQVGHQSSLSRDISANPTTHTNLTLARTHATNARTQTRDLDTHKQNKAWISISVNKASRRTARLWPHGNHRFQCAGGQCSGG